MYLCAVFCNGKEFVEAHGYNVYDYGFREYYAAIGRFMTMDPLAEMTPWKSPYSYAGNNFVNKIDYMGLFEDYPTNPDGSPCYDCPSPSEFVHNNDYEWNAFNKDGSLNEDWWYENGYLDGGGYNWGGVDFSSLGFNPYDINLSFIMLGEKTLLPGVDMLEWVAIDQNGNVVGWGDDNNDHSVYQVDKTWNKTYEGLKGHSKVVGWELIGKNGEKPNYVIGQPTYYLRSVRADYYDRTKKETCIVRKQVLMYGNNPVNTQIDDNSSALIHYWFGFGSDIALGYGFTKRYMLANPEFQSYREKILNGEMDKTGHFAINMTNQVFHIGRTNVSYYSTDTYTVFCLGIDDGFWDALYMFEKSENNPNGIVPDGDGWKLEAGIPYHYIPMVVMVPNQ